MESRTIPAKCPRLSIKASVVRPKKRRLCNELIFEFCRAIPLEELSDSILLSSSNLYTYLGPQFSRKPLFYREAIAFIGEKLKHKQGVTILIDQETNSSNAHKRIVEQRDMHFAMQTNHLSLQMWSTTSRENVQCRMSHYENVQMCHLLCLLVQAIQPIALHLANYDKFFSKTWSLAHFLNDQSNSIDSIELSSAQFNSKPINQALININKMTISTQLEIGLDEPNVLLPWLTTNSSGKPKQCFLRLEIRSDKTLTQFLNEIKMDFFRATSQSPFIVRLEMWRWRCSRRSPNSLCCTLHNEVTGEKLEIRCKGRCICELRRFPNAYYYIKTNSCESTKFILE